MLSIRNIFYVFVFLFCVGCSPKFTIQTDSPHPGNFKAYQSFKFYNPANMPSSNFAFEENDKKVIFDAVADELKFRGYSSKQEADLMIKIQGGTKSSVEIRNDNRYYPNNYNAYNYNQYGRYDDYNNRPRDQSSKDASIIIDIIDVKQDKVVWQGVGFGTLSKNETLTEEKIREAISSIFLKYPYSAGTTK